MNNLSPNDIKKKMSRKQRDPESIMGMSFSTLESNYLPAAADDKSGPAKLTDMWTETNPERKTEAAEYQGSPSREDLPDLPGRQCMVKHESRYDALRFDEIDTGINKLQAGPNELRPASREIYSAKPNEIAPVQPAPRDTRNEIRPIGSNYNSPGNEIRPARQDTLTPPNEIRPITKVDFTPNEIRPATEDNFTPNEIRPATEDNFTPNEIRPATEDNFTPNEIRPATEDNFTPNEIRPATEDNFTPNEIRPANRDIGLPVSREAITQLQNRNPRITNTSSGYSTCTNVSEKSTSSCFSRPRYTGSASSNDGQILICESDIKRLTVQIQKGDIAAETTDCIVHSTHKDVSLKGQVGSTLSKKGGKKFKESCKSIRGFTETAFSEPGNLPCKRVLHVNILHYTLVDDSQQAAFLNRLKRLLGVKTSFGDSESISRIYLKCIEDAESKGFESMTFPAILTGKYGGLMERSAEAFANAIRMHNTERHNSSSLTLIRLVVFDKTKCKEFQDLFVRELYREDA